MKLLPGILTLVLLTAFARAQTATPPSKVIPTPAPVQSAVKHITLKYKAPSNVVAGSRHDIDAGSRGWTAKMPSLYVLAPNHTGFTTRAQPSLFWYQSGPTNMRIELTIIEPKKPKVILRVGAENADQAGIHRLVLSRYNISLTPGVLYKWTVALVPDPASRSQDIIASDTIRRIKADSQLSAAIGGRKESDKSVVYAANGVWYDALEAITNEIDATPKDKELRRLRAGLLDQGDLGAAAAFERR